MFRRSGVTRPSSGDILQPIKCRLIDAVFSRLQPKSFADLGGVWAVDAGYTFYALNRYQVDRAVLVDTGMSDSVRERARRETRLDLVEEPFGSAQAESRVGQVDAVIMFDVLLHQVKPNWDEILKSYATHTNAFLIVDPQWLGPRTVRLLDLGETQYHEVVPRVPTHNLAWSQLDEMNTQYGRPWRDIHEIWQWGIVENDIRDLFEGLGFSLVYYENSGSWNGLAMFENHAFGYVRQEVLDKL